MRGDELKRLDAIEPEAVETGMVAVDRRTCAIDVRNAVLQYPLGPVQRGSIKAGLMKLVGGRGERVTAEYVDAIRGVDLSIQHGERVALIGTNGSGKSTLLRAMAGVYPLKTGSIRISGQIGTLLDTTLGFEAEATGRENIYFRGMAMGISPARIRKAELAIISFADIGKFIDLPLRTYSAGMTVRLGFAVSTHFMPDVLLVDEVFGAGDASFAAKAIRRMHAIVSQAGILVMATHDMGLVQSLCNRVIWLKSGEIERDGPPEAVVPQFMSYATGRAMPVG